VASLTSLQKLILKLGPDPVNNLNELTTLTNLQYLYFYNADSEDFDRDWKIAFDYAKQMTNLMTISTSYRYHQTKDKCLAYGWQRIKCSNPRL